MNLTPHRHFDVELAELKRALVGMGDLAGQAVAQAVASLRNPSADAGERAKAAEAELDALDTAIVERSQALIALQSPRAGDLRFLISATRIAADLENIGDLARSVAKRAAWIARHELVEQPAALFRLGALAIEGVRLAMEAFVSGNLEAAKAVFADEDRADALAKEAMAEVEQRLAGESGRQGAWVRLLRAAGHLEQIADLAAGIAEEAVFIHRGDLIRHHREELA